MSKNWMILIGLFLSLASGVYADQPIPDEVVDLPPVQMPVFFDEEMPSMDGPITVLIPTFPKSEARSAEDSIDAPQKNKFLRWMNRWGPVIRLSAITGLTTVGMMELGGAHPETAFVLGGTAGALSASIQLGHQRLENWIVFKGFLKPLFKKQMDSTDQRATVAESLGAKVYLLELTFLSIVEAAKGLSGAETVFTSNSDIWSALFDFAVYKAGFAWLVEAPLIWMLMKETKRQKETRPHLESTISGASRVAAILVSVVVTSFAVMNLGGAPEPLQALAAVAVPSAFGYWAATSSSVKRYLKKFASPVKRAIDSCRFAVSRL